MKKKESPLNYIKNDLLYLKSNFDGIVGVDEAGRGALAGPVVAASVWVSKKFYHSAHSFNLIQDSKSISSNLREKAFKQLQELKNENLIYFTWAASNSNEVDQINVLASTKLAMKRSVKKLSKAVELNLSEQDNFLEGCVHKATNAILLIDGLPLKNFHYPHHGIVKGDQKHLCIAAASIIAKVQRDKIMQKIHLLYPEYNFSNNKGYGTKKHMNAIVKYGPSKVHRNTFLKKLFEKKQKAQSMQLSF